MRKKYSHLLSCRRDCFINMLVKSTDHLLGQLGVHDSEIDELFKEIDETISRTNQDIEVAQQKAFRALLPPNVDSAPHIDWQTVITKVCAQMYIVDSLNFSTSNANV